MFEILITTLCIITVSCLRLIYLNEKTYQQLNHLLDVIFSCENWWDLLKDMRQVSYSKHVWSLFILRNPKNLYSEKIQKLWEEHEIGL